MQSGDGLCVDCHITWPPSSGPCKSICGVSLTCFTPGEIPGHKGFILIKENEISGIIRRHLGSSEHESVECMNVNLLDFTRNPSYL